MDKTRVLVFNKNDAPLFEIPPEQVHARKRVETLNGEHALTISTERILEKGWRVLTWDDKWREWVVTGIDEQHTTGKHAIGTYYAVWSIQHDLLVTRTDKQPGTKVPVSATAALQAALSETTRWGIGTVTVQKMSGASMYRMSAWEALSVVVENWGGEIDAQITVGPDGVVSRAVDLKSTLGRSYIPRRFDWSYDVVNIGRKVTDDPNACRIVPIGASIPTDEGGYTRKITIENVNGGKDYLENENVVRYYRLPKPGGGWEYPTIQVENHNMDTPAKLKAWGLSVLEQYTTPKVTYTATVAFLKEAGMDTTYLQLGDTVHVVDRGFTEEGLRLEGRVSKMTVNELVDGDITLEIGSLTPTLANTINGVAMTAYAARSAAEAAQSAADGLSENFWVDENGVHVTTTYKMVDGKNWGTFKKSTWGGYRYSTWKNASEAVFEPTQSGYNLFIDGEGVHVRDGSTQPVRRLMKAARTRAAEVFNDLGKFAADIIRLGKPEEKHMDLTANGLELFDGETSLAEFTAEQARIGEEDKGHVSTTTQQVQVWNGTSDIAVATMGTGAVDTPHETPVDGIFVPNGQVAATSLYSWASKTGWSMPTNILHPGGQPMYMARGSMGFLQDGTPEVIAFNGSVAIGISDEGLLINLDNQMSGSQRKTGWFQIAWDGTVSGSGI